MSTGPASPITAERAIQRVTDEIRASGTLPYAIVLELDGRVQLRYLRNPHTGHPSGYELHCTVIESGELEGEERRAFCRWLCALSPGPDAAREDYHSLAVFEPTVEALFPNEPLWTSLQYRLINLENELDQMARRYLLALEPLREQLRYRIRTIRVNMVSPPNHAMVVTQHDARPEPYLMQMLGLGTSVPDETVPSPWRRLACGFAAWVSHVWVGWITSYAPDWVELQISWFPRVYEPLRRRDGSQGSWSDYLLHSRRYLANAMALSPRPEPDSREPASDRAAEASPGGGLAWANLPNGERTMLRISEEELQAMQLGRFEHMLQDTFGLRPNDSQPRPRNDAADAISAALAATENTMTRLSDAAAARHLNRQPESRDESVDTAARADRSANFQQQQASAADALADMMAETTRRSAAETMRFYDYASTELRLAEALSEQQAAENPPANAEQDELEQFSSEPSEDMRRRAEALLGITERIRSTLASGWRIVRIELREVRLWLEAPPGVMGTMRVERETTPGAVLQEDLVLWDGLRSVNIADFERWLGSVATWGGYSLDEGVRSYHGLEWRMPLDESLAAPAYPEPPSAVGRPSTWRQRLQDWWRNYALGEPYSHAAVDSERPTEEVPVTGERTDIGPTTNLVSGGTSDSAEMLFQNSGSPTNLAPAPVLNEAELLFQNFCWPVRKLLALHRSLHGRPAGLVPGLVHTAVLHVAEQKVAVSCQDSGGSRRGCVLIPSPEENVPASDFDPTLIAAQLQTCAFVRTELQDVGKVEFRFVRWNSQLISAHQRLPDDVWLRLPEHLRNASNVSQDGWRQTDAGGWIGPDVVRGPHTLVLGNAIVCQGAELEGTALVQEFAIVSGRAKVRNEAMVAGHARVDGVALIGGRARVTDHSSVRGHAVVDGKCLIGGAATVTDNAIVSGNAVVNGRAFLRGYACAYDCSLVESGILEGYARIGGRHVIRGGRFSDRPLYISGSYGPLFVCSNEEIGLDLELQPPFRYPTNSRAFAPIPKDVGGIEKALVKLGLPEDSWTEYAAYVRLMMRQMNVAGSDSNIPPPRRRLLH